MERLSAERIISFPIRYTKMGIHQRPISAITILLIPQVLFELLAYVGIGICAIETSLVVFKSVSSSSMISLATLVRCSLNYLLVTFILIIISFYIKCNYYYITDLILDLLV